MLNIIARWTIAGDRDAAIAALQELAAEVEAGEPGTWMYTIHTPDMTGHNLPGPSPDEIVFFSVFADANAFQEHLNGPIFSGWRAKYLNLFLTNAGNLFVLAEYLDRQTGFVRDQMVTTTPAGART
jgi:quinol monooxygenase YgiN